MLSVSCDSMGVCGSHSCTLACIRNFDAYEHELDVFLELWPIKSLDLHAELEALIVR